MAAFNHEDLATLGWRLLQNGSVNLYWRPEILLEDVTSLEAEGYRSIIFDCSGMTDEEALLKAFGNQLDFPNYYGPNSNLDGLNDCLSDLIIGSQGETGLVLVFKRFDVFTAVAAKTAGIVLDILEHNSRRFLLFGQRLIALVQTDDPSASYDPVGARQVSWNPREMLNKSRGV